MRYIREGRFGPGKTGKTYHVITSYPKPMVVYMFDPGGLDIIQAPIVWKTSKELVEMSKLPQEQLPPITAVDCTGATSELDITLKPTANSEALKATLDGINALVRAKPIPWKTAVFDPLTGLNDQIIWHISKDQPATLADARKWGGLAGGKMNQILNTIVTLPMHTVCIMHSSVIEDEKTDEVKTRPMLTGRIKDRVQSIFSQFFFQNVEAGATVLYTAPMGLLEGLGTRWPDLRNNRRIVNPTFQAIYGDESKLQ